MERTGSVKDKRVHPALQENRDRLDFDQEELVTLIASSWGDPEQKLALREKINKITESEPILQNKPEWYGMSREDKFLDIYERIAKFREI